MAKCGAHKCCVLGFTDQHKSLHVLPKEEDVSNKWREFVSEGRCRDARVGSVVISYQSNGASVFNG